MLGLPASTEFNKRIPKQKFYDHADLSSTLKRYFVEQIKSIYWVNKIAPSVVNLEKGKYVTEIEVIEIHLYSPELNEGVLKLVNKTIPYHILFLLEYDQKYQVWIEYKPSFEADKGSAKAARYYHTEWQPEENLSIHLDGLNMDEAWDNMVLAVSGIKLEHGRSLEEQIAIEDKRVNLEDQITRLEKKVWGERQPKRKFELNQELKSLKKELEEL